MSLAIDRSSPTFGLPACLLVPIAATDPKAIEAHVGHIVRALRDKDGNVAALCISSPPGKVQKPVNVPLWAHPRCAEFEQRLFPNQQVWVHVDYAAYRSAYVTFGMPSIPAGYFLDHVQNREAIRLRQYSHPYLRLCPVSRGVNTSGGHLAGGEGMEKDFLRNANTAAATKRELQRRISSYSIVYADPMDLTKMLDIRPGTGVLNGVRDMLALFYPR